MFEIENKPPIYCCEKLPCKSLAISIAREISRLSIELESCDPVCSARKIQVFGHLSRMYATLSVAHRMENANENTLKDLDENTTLVLLTQNHIDILNSANNKNESPYIKINFANEP